MKPPRKVPGVENRQRIRRDGTIYWTFRVRWRDPLGNDQRQEFDRQEDAQNFRAMLRLATASGQLAEITAGRQTIAEYAEHWWQTYAQHNLATNTLVSYAGAWNRHALPRIGHFELRQITPPVMAALRNELAAAGCGAPTIRLVLAVVQSMLRRAVEEGHIRANPVAQITKPPAPRQRAVQPLTPEQAEALRAVLPPGDAAFVSVLAYAGLRPEEALALEWRHVRKATLLVEQKIVRGEIVIGQKTRRRARSVDLLGPLRADLAAHKLDVDGPTTARALVFPAPDRGPWDEHRYRNWRARTFRKACAKVGLATAPPWSKGSPYDGPVPYDLRHSFASLLLHAGKNPVYVAEQLGHSVEMLFRTYSHVIADLRDQPTIDPETLIRAARNAQRTALDAAR